MIIIVFVFLVSTMISFLIYKKREDKRLGMLVAFCVNTFILVIAACTLYTLNDEARLFGFGQSDLYVFILSIPIITWTNFLILQFIRGKETRTGI